MFSLIILSLNKTLSIISVFNNSLLFNGVRILSVHKMNLLCEGSITCLWTIKFHNFLVTACSRCNKVIQLGLGTYMPSQFLWGWYDFYSIFFMFLNTIYLSQKHHATHVTGFYVSFHPENFLVEQLGVVHSNK